MGGRASWLHDLIAQLRQRRVLRVAGIYVVAAWVVIQAAETLAPLLLLPDWIPRAVALVCLLGFPVAVALSWAFDVDADGIRRAEASSGPQPAALRSSGRRGVLLGLGVVVVLAAGFARARRAAPDVAKAGGHSFESVAVLPFFDMSPGQDQQYLADGISEEILSALAKVPGLKVPAASSSFRFRGRAEDPRKVGQQLGVEAILEGSVRSIGDRLKVSATLLRAPDGYQVWSETFERSAADAFAVQEEVAQAILRELGFTRGVSDAPLVSGGTANAEALNLYLRARQHFRGGRQEDILAARDLLERAVAIDPSFARAYAALSHNYYNLAFWYLMPAAEARERAVNAVAKALELEPRLDEAYLARAGLLLLERRVTEAEGAYRQAIRLNPGAAEAHLGLGELLAGVGRLEEALRELHLAVELDPLSMWTHARLASALLASGDLDGALAAARRSTEQDSTGLLFLAAVQSKRGDHASAVGAMEAAVRRVPGDFDGLTNLAMIHHRAGNGDSARAILRRLTSNTPGLRSAPHAGQLYGILGQPDSAFVWLARAEQEQPEILAWLLKYNLDPTFDALRPEPRFQRLLERYGYR